MRLDTTRFGVVDVADDDVFAVPGGIPGFPRLRRVALFSTEGCGDDPLLYWLQDVDDGGLAFLCVPPWNLFPDYEIDIDEHALGIEDPATVHVLNLVTVGHAPSTDTPDRRTVTTVNLRAPLVVDLAAKRIQQVILDDRRWSVFAAIGSDVRSGFDPC